MSSPIRRKELDARTASEAAEAAVRGAEPLAQNGYKVALVRGVVEKSLSEAG